MAHELTGMQKLTNELRDEKQRTDNWQAVAVERERVLNMLRAEYSGFKMGVRAALDALKLK